MCYVSGLKSINEVEEESAINKYKRNQLNCIRETILAWECGAYGR